MTAILKVDGLVVSYAGVPALHGVSVEIPRRALVCIIGSNGAGKTSLLKAISGTVPSTGSIEFDGRDITALPAHQRSRMGLCHVPQGRRVFGSLSVEENLRVAVAYRGDEASLKHVFDLFPVLGDRRNQDAGTLSGGEQQMLAIGRGLVSAPKCLMLDEPTMGLAPTLVETMFDAIETVHASGDVTILLVEQRARATLEVAQRAYVMESGDVVASGETAELLDDDRVRKAYLGM